MISINPQGLLTTVDNNGQQEEVTGVYTWRLRYARDLLAALEKREPMPDPDNYISWTVEANLFNT